MSFPIKDFILINKPAGWTSFDVVGFIRKKIRAEHPELKNIKVGHAGTLDPFATGLLIVAVGREATKKLNQFKNMPKTYRAAIHLGAVSDTQDKTGKITAVIPTDRAEDEGAEESLLQTIRNSSASILTVAPVGMTELEDVVRSFLGSQLQTPPMFSAKKINGRRLYKLARQGKEIDRKPVIVEIYDIKIEEYNWPILKIKIQCSPGTYIRTLANDIGQKLGVGAYCEELARTAIGEYQLEQAKNLP